MSNYIIVEINGKKLPLRWESGISICGKSVCGADDLYDLGFSVEEVKQNDVILHIPIGGVDTLKITLK